MARSVAIIGAGQIGFASACAFQSAGWEITIHSRSRPAWTEFPSEWRQYEAGTDPAPQADVVIDTIAFDETDITRYDPDMVGRLIAISSASVYCDEQGRTLDEGPINGYPQFTGPITEDQSTVAPGDATYSTRKVRMENKAIERFGNRATILRPCAIYGQYSRHLREWWFIKRLMDGRNRIPLLLDGRSQFQTTNVLGISEFALEAAERELAGIFNISDTDTPTVREIGLAICNSLNREVNFIDSGSKGFVGRTPWSVPHPFAVSGKKAHSLLHEQRFDYADHVGDGIAWTRNVDQDQWQATFPQLAAYPWDLFDYAAEDRFFDERT
ncbi:MAG: reductase [Pseudomonadota bacterium]